MACVSDMCTQGREPCPTPTICLGRQHREASSEFYDYPAEDFTQNRPYGVIDLALTFIAGVVIAAIVIGLVHANWPLFVWAAGAVP